VVAGSRISLTPCGERLRVANGLVRTHFELVSPTAVYTLYGLRQVDATLAANGLSQPLIIGETI